MRLGRLITRLRKIAAFAALFGILLQLAIAATHHHADLFGASLSGQKTAVALPDDGRGPPTDESTCQICLGLAFGTAFILPAAVVLDLLSAMDAATAVVPRAPDSRTQLAFRSRAPPSLI